jgi:hypothetical protein
MARALTIIKRKQRNYILRIHKVNPAQTVREKHNAKHTTKLEAKDNKPRANRLDTDAEPTQKQQSLSRTHWETSKPNIISSPQEAGEQQKEPRLKLPSRDLNKTSRG